MTSATANISNLDNKGVHEAGKMARWVKVLAAKCDGLMFNLKNPHGRRSKPTPPSCSDIHAPAISHVQIIIQTKSTNKKISVIFKCSYILLKDVQ